jgi:hypothetical protein
VSRFSRPFGEKTPPETINDPVFGTLTRDTAKDDWTGSVDLAHPPTRLQKIHVMIDAGSGPPTNAQRRFLLELRDRYAQLWPVMARALANYHEEFKTIELIQALVDEPTLTIDRFNDGERRHWTLQFSLNDEQEGDMGYFIDFVDWEIAEVTGAD